MVPRAMPSRTMMTGKRLKRELGDPSQQRAGYRQPTGGMYELNGIPEMVKLNTHPPTIYLTNGNTIKLLFPLQGLAGTY